MNEEVEINVVMNYESQKCRFTIQVPFSLIKNTNFLEIMDSYQPTNPVGWRDALANFIRETTNAKES